MSQKRNDFSLGEVIISETVQGSSLDMTTINNLLSKHSKVDWGNVKNTSDDQHFIMNESNQLFSSFRISCDEEDELWFITEPDKSVTNILFPTDH